MKRRNQSAMLLLIAFLSFAGCSRKKSENRDVSQQPGTGSSNGVVTGTTQLALKSGDVKNLAFTSVRLAPQGYEVLTEAERQDIAYDTDVGMEASRLGLVSMDELDRRAKAKVRAMESFQGRLPQKLVVPAFATATTDANGSFRFDRVPPGIYWILLDTQIGPSFVGWNARVEVKPGQTTKTDLNNTNVDYSARW